MLRAFCLPAATAAETKTYARPAITVAAATEIRLAISTAIVRPRSVSVAVAIVWAIITIAIVAVITIMLAPRAEVSGLLHYVSRGFRSYRLVRGIRRGTTEQRSCADGKYDSYKPSRRSRMRATPTSPN